MTTNNDVTEKASFLAKLKSVKHIEIIAVALLVCICLSAYFLYPSYSDKVNVSLSEDNQELCKDIADIISKIDGVGNCEILITYEDNEKVTIAFDEETVTNITTDSDDNSNRVTENTTTTSKPVIITVDGVQQPLIISKSPARIKGIVVVAEGGDDIYTKIQIIDAICALTNVDGNCIKVYKMD